MIRRTLLLAAALGALLPVASAGAMVIPVRIEGKTATLFEGPVDTGPGYIQAASDPQRRVCDGTNNGQNPTGSATATKAATDAMRIVGSDFDGTWYPGFDDYFIERFGPDRQDEGPYDYWGVLVNEIFTPVGGCQQQVTDGQRVLWAYDAFHKRGFLTLRVAGDAAVSPATTTTVPVGSPLVVSVGRTFGTEDEPVGPAAGVDVGEVDTDSSGVETIRAAGRVPTAADGTAQVVFTTPGWHRIKATGEPTGSIRSNRLDVCVSSAAQPSCGAPPADTLVRTAPPLAAIPDGPGHTAPAATPVPTPGGGVVAPVGAPVIEFPTFTHAGDRAGLVALSWRILQPGVGVTSWKFAYRQTGAKRGAFRAAKTGTTGTTAQLRLPAGRAWDVQATFTDTLGRSVTELVGDVLVPIDDGASSVRYAGTWTRRADQRAWKGHDHRGAAGATATTTLAAGRPVVLVRSVGKTADVEIRARGAKTEVLRVSRASDGRPVEAAGSRRARSGSVRVRVVRGAADVDGFGVRP
ncbi:MAG: hypothetical protein AAGC46_18715 [Solirubrobacteraceae bacterium]|nr:hypothetical protein [Patulibacter sp.]